MREPGYYWIILDKTSNWTIAEWYRDFWSTIGYEGPVFENEVKEVGEKIEGKNASR